MTTVRVLAATALLFACAVGFMWLLLNGVTHEGEDRSPTDDP